MPVTASIAAFAALTLALVALWLTHILTARIARNLRLGAGLMSVVLALAGRMVDVTGLAALTALTVVCMLARRATHPAAVVITHVLLVLGCAALFVHVVPGFQNPVLVSNTVLGLDAQPYTKYLNYDKGMAALLLLRDPGAVALTPLRKLLLALGFLYALWAVIGSGRDTVFWGFLLLLSGLPVYVLLQRNRAS